MTGHIFIYGEVGRGMGQVSINTVRAQMDPAASDYILHIVSPGGDVFEGFGIYNILKNCGKDIVTHIEGVTASISTLLAFAGRKIIMNKTAEFMVHNPYITDLKGDAHEVRNVAGQLDKIKALLIDVSGRRAARNGKSISNEELVKLYDNETWLTSTEAHNMGFVDEVVDAIRAVAKADLTNPILKMEQKEKGLIAFFKNLLGLKKFKNEFTETLQDGTVVVVMSEDGDWTGKQVVTQEGEPLPAGDYTLASGKVISVGENSTISEVKEQPAAAENNEDMSKIKELETQLAAAKAGQQAAEAKAAELQTATQATEAKMEARFKALEAGFKTKEEDDKKVVGKTPALNRGPILALGDDAGSYDPMGEFAAEILSSRNRID